jgi:hypothetical protein
MFRYSRLALHYRAISQGRSETLSHSRQDHRATSLEGGRMMRETESADMKTRTGHQAVIATQNAIKERRTIRPKVRGTHTKKMNGGRKIGIEGEAAMTAITIRKYPHHRVSITRIKHLLRAPPLIMKVMLIPLTILRII